MSILFISINAQNLAQYGIKALNARQDKSIIMTGNVESVNYRKSVFPELRLWMKLVFSSEKEGFITTQERIDLFTFIREKSVRGILNYRAKHSTTMASQAKRIAELETDLAKAKETVKRVQKENFNLKIKVKNHNEAVKAFNDVVENSTSV